MSIDEAFSVNNQAVAFCIALEDEFEDVDDDIRGVQCGTVSTGDDSTEAAEFRTYWFPISIVDTIKDDTPLDMWDSAYDDNKIDDYYYGLTQFYTRMASSTTIVADKFQFKEVNSAVQWSNVDDYRFKIGDTISLYRMQ